MCYGILTMQMVCIQTNNRYNPTYDNKEKTVEPHLIAPADHPQRHASFTEETQFNDFYDKT